MTRRAAGLRAWVLQRVTAVYIGLFSVYALGKFVLDPPASHQHWQDWMAGSGVRVAVLLFFVALLLHAWVGVRDIFIDYVRPTPLRLALLSFVAIGLIACGLWALDTVIQFHGT